MNEEIQNGLGEISSARLGELCHRYRHSDVTAEKFTGAVSDYKLYQDLVDLALHHPHPVTRHEASFLLGELGLTNAIPDLMRIVMLDKSIVAKHEAAESLGKLGENSDEAYGFLKAVIDPHNRKYEEGVYHSDVQATAELAIRQIDEKRSK